MAYSKVQFIAFNIRPDTATRKSSGRLVYLGEKNAEDDITVRCEILKHAIREAYKLVSEAESKAKPVVPKRGSTTSTIDDARPLKIFMAPEFYFRGADGAYPIEKVSRIMDEMKVETDKAEPPNPSKPTELTYDYSDWLFVFGTAIGYLRHDQADATVLAARTDVDGKTIVTVDSIPEGPRDNLMVVASRPPAQITAIAVPSLGRPELTLSAACPTGWSASTSGPTTSAGGPFPVAVSSGSKITIDCAQGLCPLKGCTCDVHFNWFQQPCQKCRHWHLPFDVGSNLTFADIRAKVLSVFDATAPTISVQGTTGQTTHMYKAPRRLDLKLDTQASFLPGDKVSIERTGQGLSEITNVALVRKGGKPKTGATGQRDAVVYKEYVSHIDFIRPPASGSTPRPDWDESSGSGRNIKLQGKKVTVMPTSGSRDLLAADPNVSGATKTWTDKDAAVHTQRISEINEKGGGGGVFTIDGITYGLEVCLDHGKNRLYAFYNDHFVCPTCGEVSVIAGICQRHNPPVSMTAKSKGALSGDPKVQIHLIPSWGMTIGGGEVVCVDGGLTFNVDGSRCDAVVRNQDGTYRCDDHKTVTSTTRKDCGRHFVCWTCQDLRTQEQTKAGKCPDCGSAVAPYPVMLIRMGSIVPTERTEPLKVSTVRADWAQYYLDSPTRTPRLEIFRTQDIPPAAKV